MALTLRGPVSRTLVVDDDGFKEYTIVYRLEGDDKRDGPNQALLTAGLPLPGSMYNLGNDIDPWAFCKPNTRVTEVEPVEGGRFFLIEKYFTTRPINRCHTTSVSNPLLEPQKVSGGFTRFTEEATKDRFGVKIMTSSFELIRGPQVEFDNSRPTVRIEQNVPFLGLTMLATMRDTVNDRPLWGMPARCIKLSGVTWNYLYYGQCLVYAKRVLDFEINTDTWDRSVLDEGTKALSGHWDPETGNYVLDPVRDAPGGEWVPGIWEPGIEENWVPDAGASPNPNKNNPSHFIRFKDKNGENARVLLCDGIPFNPPKDETTDACSECSIAPFRWAVFGLTDIEQLTLEHVADCEWEANDYEVFLQTSGAGWGLTQTDEDGNVTEWRNEQLTCDGPNILVKDEGDEGPLYVILIPVPKEAPCEIAIEKYDQSNFLLLGIPSTLEPGMLVGPLGSPPPQVGQYSP